MKDLTSQTKKRVQKKAELKYEKRLNGPDGGKRRGEKKVI